jgi:hypothetical protein
VNDSIWFPTKAHQNNPKLKNSNIIDCIPQTGQCPNKCLECYYNAPGFFRTKEEPLVPTLEEVGDKIVRVNSGHDSNIQKELVLKVTEQYPKKFYNTSIPNFDFPAPVVFTCNGRDTDFSATIVTDVSNLMAVRFRTNTWNVELLDAVVKFYAIERSVPLTITFMRYTLLDSIPDNHKRNYEIRKNVLNNYYCLKRDQQDRIVKRAKKQVSFFDESSEQLLVGMCGTLTSSYCVDCGRCEWAYERREK